MHGKGKNMRGNICKICMEKVPQTRCETKRSDYVLTSIEALKGSSGELSSLSEQDDPMYGLSQIAGRLRGIIALVNSGYLTMEILLNNLEAAARTLEGQIRQYDSHHMTHTMI